MEPSIQELVQIYCLIQRQYCWRCVAQTYSGSLPERTGHKKVQTCCLQSSSLKKSIKSRNTRSDFFHNVDEVTAARSHCHVGPTKMYEVNGKQLHTGTGPLLEQQKAHAFINISKQKTIWPEICDAESRHRSYSPSLLNNLKKTRQSGGVFV